jgi:threonine dehydrogenase-like Zn-dependent dehydrogenase
MSSSQQLPTTCRALVCTELGKPLTVEIRPVPEVLPGTVLIQVLSTTIEAGYKILLSGGMPELTIPTPMIPGSRAVGRIAAIGPDTTTLKVGQLVICEPFVRGRDNTDVQILWGLGVFGNNPSAIKLAENVWRDGMSAEYARAPLENTHALDEKVLLGSPAHGGLGYEIADLTYMARFAVPYGGFRGIDLKAGETVIVAPATGAYSSAAVEVAIAMGAKVIAVGRNLEKLKKVGAINPRVRFYELKNDPAIDIPALRAFGSIDAYMDLSPAIANDSTHVGSCMMALKPYGRVSLMGVIMKDINIPYGMAVLNNLTIQGKYMYEREDVKLMIKMVEAGVLKLGKEAGHEVVGRYKMEEFEEGLNTAMMNQSAGRFVVFEP